MLARVSTWLVDTAARRPSGWIGRHRFGGVRGAPRDHEPTFDRVLSSAGALRGLRCLDVGCGGGRLLERALEAGVASAAGLDHSPAMIELSQQRNADAAARGVLELRVGDAAALPWPDATFDLVLCANVFFFFTRPERMLAEARRVLRPAGRLVLATAQGPLPRFTVRHPTLYLWGHELHVHTDDELCALVERAGFAEVRIESKRGQQLVVARRPE